MRILIVEDNEKLAESLRDILGRQRYETDVCLDGAEGYEMVMSGLYDGVILDVMLPQMNGFQVLRSLRAGGSMVPVLMLTARGELADRVQGLDSGADYYLTKPFENQELLACLRTILRRQPAIVPELLTFGDLTLNPASSQLSRGEKSVTLSSKELEMLTILFKNAGCFIPKETLLLKIWGYDSSVNANSVEAYVSFIRKKLALLQSSVTVRVARNIGYTLEDGR